MAKYVLALDQGTTSSRAILFNEAQEIVELAQKEFTQIYPKEGWVEHNPMEIYSSQVSVMMEVPSACVMRTVNCACISVGNPG